ncbi:tryptophan--tRNA ligase [Candidatus Roizmanbacteria bacterium RIFCSPHIGHO2_01_FULL_39_12b]|uniref:Tryptophan--tRNA ligase n=1 Tax=Candidatus Roizmanbacteria bacterium RIFCSPHIGHO2_01_FULL_39_12b TaxID=1802030 RepID=A0A1F7GC69_9BACT|nr:MAG: tryptophan--tRNA ligase [Candidatus Roizmanbacteria bacterium RIFCSPHIGHO2_01_FULL_39_12b]OGK47067.1 MAG: tryptophan--tRNA ligase [Candidatus Roizmanbacteria bacterium RIFCSPLOWO2_01_FULL_39_19]
MKKRVLNGMRATGKLHLGNYLGSAKGMTALQETSDHECLYCVVDLHAMTTPYDKVLLQHTTRSVIIDYLACGIDPDKSALFVQSHVTQHAEFAFFCAMMSTVARCSHLPTYKEKVKQYPQHVTMAMLNYPMLMTSDILLYKATDVPVGLDQEPHMEIAREVARRFNADYGMDFPEPQRFITKGQYIPSLTGEGKMSKSVEGSYIALTDDLDTIRKKIRSVPTATVAGGEMSPSVKTLFVLLELLAQNECAQFKKAYDDQTLKFVELKDALSDAIYKELKPIQTKRHEIESNIPYVDKVIKEGAEKARDIASKTVREVKEKMGLLLLR